MIKEYIVKKVLEGAFEGAKKLLKESGRRVLSTRDDIENSIDYHMKEVESWSSEVSFNDLQKTRHTADVYVDLDLYVQPRRLHLHPSEAEQSVPFKNILDTVKDHLILLGQPGAGKTTSMKQLCHLILHDSDFQADRFNFPILIRFRDLNSIKKPDERGLIINKISNILELETDLPATSKQRKIGEPGLKTKEKLVTTFLNDLHVLLVLDGFDELAPTKHRLVAVDEIRNLARQLINSTMIITSRTGEFVYSIDKATSFEFCPLKREQVTSFAFKWLGNKQQARDFTTKVYRSPFADTTMRPLTLAHLCAIYERIGKIPEKPKTIYKKVISLLLEEWDQQRSVVRESRYAHFEVDRKFEFLCQLAYVLTAVYHSTTFSKDDLLAVYYKIYQDYGLLKSEASQVVSEIETHTGLLLQSGYERFEFAHKSLQEYLTAEYLVRLPSIPTDRDTLSALPNELAIAIAISSKPSEYFSTLVINRLLNLQLPKTFFKAFLERVLLEKPDFNTSNKVAIALVALYSKYVDIALINPETNRVWLHSEDLSDEFEEIFELILRRSSLGIIQSNYDKDYEYRRRNGQIMLCMKKRSSRPQSGEMAGIINSLPRTLYVNSAFLESQSAPS
ncbi:MAG: NACHT domain-containing protein [Acidobacteriota bacterium]